MGFVLSSPSGAGKTTLTKKLAKNYTNFTISISNTTRKPRLNEIHGKDYYFVNKKKFNSLIANSSFSWWGAWLNDIEDKLVIAPMHYMGWGVNKWVPISFEYHPKDWNYINVLELISKGK